MGEDQPAPADHPHGSHGPLAARAQEILGGCWKVP